MLKQAASSFLVIGLWASLSTSGASDATSSLPPSPAGSVQFTIRICEGKERLQFWFNDEATPHWNNCEVPVPDVPVFVVTDSGKRSEGKTGKDGIAEVPNVTLQANERFRMAMACTTHNCFSIHGLFIGMVNPGPNTLYAETVVKQDQPKH